MIPLLLITLAAYAFLAWKNLRAAFLLFIAALPTYVIRFTLGGIPTTALEMMFIILFAAWMLKREKRLVDIRGWRVLLLLWLVVATLAVFISPDTRSAAGIWKAYFVEPMIFFIIANDLLRSERERYSAILALAAGASVVVLSAAIQYLTGWNLPTAYDGIPPAPGESEERRATAFYGYPNAIGLYLAPLIPLLIAARKKRWMVIASVLFFAAIVLARSEGAIVGLLAALIFAGLMLRRTRAVTILGAIIVAAIIFAVPATRELALQKLTLSDWSGDVRKVTWVETWEMLKDNPILGAGLSAYPIMLQPYHKAGHLEIFQYPHQIILNFWSELGLAGIVIFIAIVWVFFKSKGPLAYKAAMVVLIVHGLVDVPYFKNDLAMQFWLLLALMSSTAAESHRAAKK